MAVIISLDFKESLALKSTNFSQSRSINNHYAMITARYTTTNTGSITTIYIFLIL